LTIIFDLSEISQELAFIGRQIGRCFFCNVELRKSVFSVFQLSEKLLHPGFIFRFDDDQEADYFFEGIGSFDLTTLNKIK